MAGTFSAHCPGRWRPWEDERFRRLLADCVREARRLDPTPFAAWLERVGPKSDAQTLRRAFSILALFEGRVLPQRLFQQAERLQALRGEEVQTRTWLGMAFAWVPPGEFWMGASNVEGEQNYDPEAFVDESPVRRVQVTQGFWLGLHPVTNARYRAFVVATGHREPSPWSQEGFDEDNQPVTGVDCSDASEFCAWFQGQLGTGHLVGLPTEAQWERAARGDDARRFPWGNESPNAERAVFGGDHLAPVGGRPAGDGPYGHQELAGNVWEWCRDAWQKRYPTVSGVDTDPCHLPDMSDGALRVVRGGSWRHDPRSLRAAIRDRWPPAFRDDYIGFRVCVRPVREPAG